MDMLYLNKRDIKNLGVTMAQIIDAVGEGLQLKGLNKVQMPPISAICPVVDSFLHAMPVYVEGSKLCGMKWISGYRSNVEKGLPYISVLTDPTMGGVSAGFAFVGDIVIAEPKALIGFAGPRVIESTVRVTLPEGFQRAEFLQTKGAIDFICDRRELRRSIAGSLAMLLKQPADAVA